MQQPCASLRQQVVMTLDYFIRRPLATYCLAHEDDGHDCALTFAAAAAAAAAGNTSSAHHRSPQGNYLLALLPVLQTKGVLTCQRGALSNELPGL
jgi:hypothetical protein